MNHWFLRSGNKMKEYCCMFSEYWWKTTVTELIFYLIIQQSNNYHFNRRIWKRIQVQSGLSGTRGTRIFSSGVERDRFLCLVFLWIIAWIRHVHVFRRSNVIYRYQYTLYTAENVMQLVGYIFRYLLLIRSLS